MHRIPALLATLALALPAPALASNGHNHDTSPGNSGPHKVTICHHAGPTKTITITVDNSAQLKHHLNHGDTEGPCPASTPPPQPTGTTPTPTPPPNPPATTNPPAPAPEQPAPTQPAPAPEQPKDESLVAGVRNSHKHKHKPTKLQRDLKRQVARANKNAPATAHAEPASQRGQLPYTGAPVLLFLLLGGALIALALVLRGRAS